MKRVLLGLVIAVIMTGSGYALQDCPNSLKKKWHNCFGTLSGGGDKYIGEWQNGKKNGQGTYVWADGTKYIGEWKNDKQSGKGAYTYGKTSKFSGDEYIGEFENSLPHGQGIYKFSNGDKYIGEFKNGLQDGKCEYYMANGNKFVGEAREGSPHNGNLFLPNGNKILIVNGKAKK